MGRPNQPPQPKCCRQPGQVPSSKEEEGAERTAGSVHRETHRPQTGVAPGLSNSASYGENADGDGVVYSEPKTDLTGQGEVGDDLPGSQSVACAEGDGRNLGGPTDSRPSNFGKQAGRDRQRQGACSEEKSGFRSAHSSWEQGSRGPDSSQGVDTTTKPAKETSAVRTTETTWRTSLRAITTKAARQPTSGMKRDLRRWSGECAESMCSARPIVPAECASELW
jgi:hypothetical protein